MLTPDAAPSYFSQYFLCQLKAAEENGQDMASAVRTLYIDRDPATFRDIVLHLQGYHLAPRDAVHFVRLFVDAQFYSRTWTPDEDSLQMMAACPWKGGKAG